MARGTATTVQREVLEETSIVELLFSVTRQFTGHVTGCMAELDLTLPQGHAMRHLTAPIAQRELAARLGYDASNVTGIIDRLEANGLVERHVAADDRRVRLVSLTDKGVALMVDLHDRIINASPLLARLEPGERHTLHLLLAKLAGEEGSIP
jgi:DNA-binding MarR family transcriptional regulator